MACAIIRHSEGPAPRIVKISSLFIAYSFFFSFTANAQFKEVGPAPYSPAVARLKIRTLLSAVDEGNRKQTVDTLSGLLVWYRDLLDEELIAAWQQDSRANLPEVIKTFADLRVASGVVEFSWRQRSTAAFNLAYAPMLEDLMARYPPSSAPFFQDLLTSPPALSTREAETVCRILLDMPDTGTWRKNALRILPRYREAAGSLLTQDMRSADPDKSYRAQLWMSDLKMGPPAPATPTANRPPTQRRNRPVSPALATDGGPAAPPRVSADRPTLQSDVNAQRRQAALPAAPYSGATSGTFESTGSPIPSHAEYVFRDVPLVKMQLEYDMNTWDARLIPGDGNTQGLLVRNISARAQKRCIVHWTAVP